MASRNVITCPGCGKDVGNEECDFEQVKTPHGDYVQEFDLTCKLCGHKWRAPLRAFRERGAPPPNPFLPLHVPLG